MILDAARNILTDLADFCYPGRCQVCHGPSGQVGWLCPACDAKLTGLQAAAACQRCASPTAGDGDPCPWCLGKGRPPLGSVVRLGVFDGPLRDLILRLKYQRQWSLAEALARRLLEKPEAQQILSQAQVIVPVPLHWRRRLSRGFNQAELIARQLTSRTGISPVNALRRNRDTRTQTAVRGVAGRVENMRGAFVLRKPAAVAGKRVLLVDDVMTTGATLGSAARAVKSGDPARIDALVLAIADPKGSLFQSV